MDFIDVFRDQNLYAEDLMTFTYALSLFEQFSKPERCWCIKEANHSAFKHFSASHRSQPYFKGRDARVLSMALADDLNEDCNPLVVRRAECKSCYCVNPRHYFYGTKADVNLQRQQRNGTNIDSLVLDEIRMRRSQDPDNWTYKKLSRTYKIPLQTVGRVCRRETYDTDMTTEIKPITINLKERLNQILEVYPELKEQLKKEVEQQNNLLCPWHRKGQPGHRGNFGLMGECLDCLKELEQGRCTVDVSQFDFDIYWTVRSFWTKVEIKEPDECWLWTGATRKGNTETAAYMPSPFHKGGMQSASRVAFWTSRGYVGKHRIQHKKGCDILCCNPLHLRLSQLISIPDPTGIEKIQLNYGHFKSHLEMQGHCPNELAPAGEAVSRLDSDRSPEPLD